jgi:hypothetical protein
MPTTGMTCLPAGRLIAIRFNETNSSTKQHKESKDKRGKVYAVKMLSHF